MIYKHKNVLVYGMSSSGEWASKLLRKLKANVLKHLPPLMLNFDILIKIS